MNQICLKFVLLYNFTNGLQPANLHERDKFTHVP